jgi:hypothetical protein
MIFSCDGYRGYGDAHVERTALRGGSERYLVDGQLAGSGINLTGQLQIDLAPGVSGNTFIKGGFPCSMTGTGAEFSFRLYGVGPLGIIIGIECQWAGDLERPPPGPRFYP